MASADTGPELKVCMAGPSTNDSREDDVSECEFVDALEYIDTSKPGQKARDSTGRQVGKGGGESDSMSSPSEEEAEEDVLEKALRDFYVALNKSKRDLKLNTLGKGDRIAPVFKAGQEGSSSKGDKSAPSTKAGQKGVGSSSNPSGLGKGSKSAPSVKAERKSIGPRDNNYWVILFNDDAHSLDWIHFFCRSLTGGKSFQVQVVVQYLRHTQLTGESFVRKRSQDVSGRGALRTEARNLRSLAQDLSARNPSMDQAHVAELKRQVVVTEQLKGNFEATYWKLYNLGSLDRVMRELRKYGQSKSAFPALATRVTRHMLIAIKATLVTPQYGLRHDDIVTGNIFAHLTSGGNGKLPQFYLGDWGESVVLANVQARFAGVKESMRKLNRIVKEIQDQGLADSTVYGQLSSTLDGVGADQQVSRLDVLVLLAERLDKAIEKVSQLETDAVQSAVGSIDSMHAVLKSMEIVAEPTRYDSEEDARQAAIVLQLDECCLLQPVENGKADLTRACDP